MSYVIHEILVGLFQGLLGLAFFALLGGIDAICALSKARKDASESIRIWGAIEAIPGFIGRLSHRDRKWRWEAIEGLVKIGEPALLALMEAIKGQYHTGYGNYAISYGYTPEAGKGRKSLKKVLVRIGEPAVPSLRDTLMEYLNDDRQPHVKRLNNGPIDRKDVMNFTHRVRAYTLTLSLIKNVLRKIGTQEANEAVEGYKAIDRAMLQKRSSEIDW